MDIVSVCPWLCDKYDHPIAPSRRAFFVSSPHDICSIGVDHTAWLEKICVAAKRHRAASSRFAIDEHPTRYRVQNGTIRTISTPGDRSEEHSSRQLKSDFHQVEFRCA